MWGAKCEGDWHQGQRRTHRNTNKSFICQHALGMMGRSCFPLVCNRTSERERLVASPLRVNDAERSAESGLCPPASIAHVLHDAGWHAESEHLNHSC